LKWTGGDIRLASLDEIPRHIKLKQGDKIVTSGFSSYFPEGIPIGQVLNQKEDASNFANIKIQLYNDFSNLDYVYLINNTRQDEIQAIESQIIQKQSTSKNE
ncbi:MAG: rod shape-determining protein MreC, partial [Chitinophagales bacterium]